MRYISGWGGREVRPLVTSGCRVWAQSMYGFSILEVDQETLKVSFIGIENKLLHSATLKSEQTILTCTRS